MHLMCTARIACFVLAFATQRLACYINKWAADCDGVLISMLSYRTIAADFVYGTPGSWTAIA